MSQNHYRMSEIYWELPEDSRERLLGLAISERFPTASIEQWIVSQGLSRPSRSIVTRFRAAVKQATEKGVSIEELLLPQAEAQKTGRLGGRPKVVTIESYSSCDNLFSTSVSGQDLIQELGLSAPSIQRLRQEAWKVLEDDVESGAEDAMRFVTSLRQWILSLPGEKARARAMLIGSDPHFKASVIASLMDNHRDVTERNLTAWRIQVGTVVDNFPRVRKGALDVIYHNEPAADLLRPYLEGRSLDECSDLAEVLKDYECRPQFERAFENPSWKATQKMQEALAISDQEMMSQPTSRLADSYEDLEDLDF